MAPQINLVFAWAGMLLGFVSGMVLGMFFHREDWLGGYTSFKRRMYRLAHISFFGLGAVNLFFWFTAKNLPDAGQLVTIASWVFVVGAVTMPVCSVVMAHFPKAHMLFAIPVLSLIAGGAVTLAVVIRAGAPATPALPAINPQLSTINPP